jgi:hypothetical protein
MLPTLPNVADICQQLLLSATMPHDQLERDLAKLRWHWGSAYMFTWAVGCFVAQRRDTHATVCAKDAEGMFEQVRADYFANPVPRRRRSREVPV